MKELTPRPSRPSRPSSEILTVYGAIERAWEIETEYPLAHSHETPFGEFRQAGFKVSLLEEDFRAVSVTKQDTGYPAVFLSPDGIEVVPRTVEGGMTSIQELSDLAEFIPDDIQYSELVGLLENLGSSVETFVRMVERYKELRRVFSEAAWGNPDIKRRLRSMAVTDVLGSEFHPANGDQTVDSLVIKPPWENEEVWGHFKQVLLSDAPEVWATRIPKPVPEIIVPKEPFNYGDQELPLLVLPPGTSGALPLPKYLRVDVSQRIGKGEDKEYMMLSYRNSLTTLRWLMKKLGLPIPEQG